MSDYFQLQTAELVEKKVKQLFAPKDWPEVWAILKSVQNSSAMSTTRIELAMLKVSNGSLEKLRGALKLAERDPRDIIVGAEYLYQMKCRPKKNQKWSEEAHRQAVEKDRQQYLNWLRDESSNEYSI